MKVPSDLKRNEVMTGVSSLQRGITTYQKMTMFQICNADTDSISFCKPDLTEITPEERKSLIKELNDISPEFMDWGDDGYYKNVIIIKSKNYVLQDFNGKIKIKGSALKDQKKEPALLEFLKEIVTSILKEETEPNHYQVIYNKYVTEIMNLKDIKRWATKRTVTENVLNGTRKNETKVLDAIQVAEVSEGDKVYVYFDSDKNLKLVENFKNDHHVPHLLKRLHDTSKILQNIISKEVFINHSLKKAYKVLNESVTARPTSQN